MHTPSLLLKPIDNTQWSYMHTRGPVPRKIYRKAEQIIYLFQWLKLMVCFRILVSQFFSGELGPKAVSKELKHQSTTNHNLKISHKTYRNNDNNNKKVLNKSKAMHLPLITLKGLLAQFVLAEIHEGQENGQLPP